MPEAPVLRYGLLIRTIALSVFRLGPSGGPFLVPPRKGERMRPKGGAVGKADDFIERLPLAIVRLDSLRDAPPSLRNPSRPQNQRSLCTAFRRVRGAVPKFFRFSSTKETNVLDAFYFGIPLSGYSMPVCALARNRGTTKFMDCFHKVKTAKECGL